MKVLIATIAACIAVEWTMAQDFPGSIVYVEAGGLGGACTINVERNIFNRERWHGQLRLGYGQFNVFDPKRDFRAIPLAFSIFDRATNHHKEIGLGISYLEGMTEGYDDTEISKSVYLAPIFAYRFQRPSGGIFFKVQYLPMIKIRELTEHPVFRRGVGKVYHYPGLAVGYYFRKKD